MAVKTTGRGSRSEHAERLGQAMTARRVALGLTQEELAAASAGVGSSTLRQAESARQLGGLSNKTLGGIDRALRWKPGSAARLLRGAATNAEPLDTEGWPTISGDWVAYVGRRQREADELEGPDAVTASSAVPEQRDGARVIREFSDAELIAELARRLGRL